VPVFLETPGHFDKNMTGGYKTAALLNLQEETRGTVEGGPSDEVAILVDSTFVPA
jgi:hypothetical protein